MFCWKPRYLYVSCFSRFCSVSFCSVLCVLSVLQFPLSMCVVLHFVILNSIFMSVVNSSVAFRRLFSCVLVDAYSFMSSMYWVGKKVRSVF